MAFDLIFSSFFKALGQMRDPRFRKVFWLGILLTIALLVAAYAALLWLLDRFVGPEAYFEVLGRVVNLGDLLTASSFIFMLVLSFFLMIPVASAITSMFLDEVADAVEAKHYPQLEPKPGPPFSEAMLDTLNFLAVIIAANIVAFVLYALLPPITPFLFFGMNGFLLGREYFQLTAMRRVGREQAKALRKRHFATIWAAGTLMALPLVVPVLNLFIPILGAATFTHIFHGLKQR